MAGRDRDDATKLRDVLETAVEKHDRAAAAEALKKLAALEPSEPRWPHRLGETLARLGQQSAAEQAYVKAATMYADKGFLARAIAVGKLAAALNPAHADLVRTLDRVPSQTLRKDNRPPARKGAPEARAAPAVSILPLVPLVAPSEDELTFDDAPASCTIEVQEVDFDLAELGDDLPLSLRAPPDPDAERVAKMAGAALFADVSAEALADIAHEAERVAFEPGAVVFTKGEASDALLVLVEGSAEVRFAGRTSIEVGEGDVLGETSILEGAVRTADVRARGELVALRVAKAALDGIVGKHPEVGAVLFGLLARRLVATALETSPLFAPFDPATRAEIARAFELRRAPAGTVIQEKGKRGDGLYLELSGALEARDGEASTRLDHGTLLGHEMVLARAPAPRTVIVTQEAVLLRLPAARFTSFVTEYPPALAHLADLAARA